MQFIAQIEARHRADLRGIVQRIAHCKRFHFGFKLLQEFVRDLRHDDEAFGGDT